MSKTCKFYKKRRYVSYDNGATWQPLDEYTQGELYEANSPDCGGGNIDERWVTVYGYICDGTTKYTKEEKETSIDGGLSWQKTDVFRAGTVIETDSTDCGYEPPVVGDGYLTWEVLSIDNDSTPQLKYTPNYGDAYYSLDDGSTWEKVDSGSNLATNMKVGDKIMFKGTRTKNYTSTSAGAIGAFHSNSLKYPYVTWKIYGNVGSLEWGDDDSKYNTFDDDYCGYCAGLFAGTTVVDAKNLKIPLNIPSKTTNKYEGICSDMFAGCKLLIETPKELPIPSAGNYSIFDGMFEGCSSLVKPNFALPSTTVPEYGYRNMFKNCTSLTGTPKMADTFTTLADASFEGMFENCTSLVTPGFNITTTDGIALSTNFYDMFAGCTSMTTAPVINIPSYKSIYYIDPFYGMFANTKINYLSVTTSSNASYPTGNSGTRLCDYFNGIVSKNDQNGTLCLSSQLDDETKECITNNRGFAKSLDSGGNKVETGSGWNVTFSC